jgi:AraC-like DNA-binding protein
MKHHMNLTTTKLSSFDSLELKEATFLKATFPKHFHDSYSIGFIKNGVEKVSIGNKQLLATKNTIVVINPYEIHSNMYFDEHKWSYSSIYLNQDILNYFFGLNQFEKSGKLNFNNFIEDEVLLNQLKTFHENPELETNTKLNNIVCSLIKYNQNTSRVTTKLYKKEEINMLEAAVFIDNNFQSKIIISRLADKYKLNSTQFIRAFKAHKGITPINYVTLLRLNFAKELILKNHSMVEVALESGFYDQSHFTHSFIKHFGISPLIFKKSSHIL